MSTEPNFSTFASDARIPLVVGVVGHRDLRAEDHAGLTDSVRQVLSDFQARIPHTPIMLLSSLAEGADRLAATVALELGLTLVVVLPMAREEYERDFVSAESKQEFSQLLGQAAHCMVSPLAEGSTSVNIREAGPHRDRQYAAASAFLISHSHVLLALWDGVQTELVGGTAHTVRKRLTGESGREGHARGKIDLPECGPVIQVVTPRASGSHLQAEPYRVRRLYPASATEAEEQAEAAFARLLRRTDRYNRRATDICRARTRSVQSSKTSLLPDAATRSLPPGCIELLNQFAVADALALLSQKAWHRCLLGLSFVAVIAVLFLEIYLEFWSLPTLLLLYPACFLLAYLWYWRAKSKAYEDCYLDYRALAEGLRVDFFWRVIGLPEKAAEHYLSKYRGELQWVRQALRVVNFGAPQQPAGGPDRLRYEMALSRWARDQTGYYARAAQENQARSVRLGRRAVAVFVFALALVFVVLAIHLVSPGKPEQVSLALALSRHAVILVAVVSLALAAAVGGYAEKMAFAEQHKQYIRMASLFAHTVRRLESALEKDDFAEAEALFRELGKEALLENGDWVLLHRSRPLEVPKG